MYKYTNVYTYVFVHVYVHVYIHIPVRTYVGAGFKVRDTEHQGWSPRHHAVHTGTQAAEGKCQRALSQVPQGFRPGLWNVDWPCTYIHACACTNTCTCCMYPIHPACTHTCIHTYVLRIYFYKYVPHFTINEQDIRTYIFSHYSLHTKIHMYVHIYVCTLYVSTYIIIYYAKYCYVRAYVQYIRTY